MRHIPGIASTPAPLVESYFAPILRASALLIVLVIWF